MCNAPVFSYAYGIVYIYLSDTLRIDTLGK